MCTLVSDIPTWASYFLEQHVTPDDKDLNEYLFEYSSVLNEKVSLWNGDITKVAADAIVRAEQSRLLVEREVSDVNVTGNRLKLDENAILNGCQVGDAQITKASGLPATYIISTVFTMQQDYNELVNCYQNSLQMMLKHFLQTIVLPCIGSGLYASNPEEAAHQAIRETRNFLEKHHNQVDRVVFCVSTEEDLKIYEKLMQRYFPIEDSPYYNFSSKDFKDHVVSHPEDKELYERLRKPADVRFLQQF